MLVDPFPKMDNIEAMNLLVQLFPSGPYHPATIGCFLQ